MAGRESRAYQQLLGVSLQTTGEVFPKSNVRLINVVRDPVTQESGRLQFCCSLRVRDSPVAGLSERTNGA